MEKWYRIVERKRADKKNIEGIEECVSPSHAKNTIKVDEWANWKHSFRLIFDFEGQIFVFDSGVVTELADKIKKLKHNQT